MHNTDPDIDRLKIGVQKLQCDVDEIATTVARVGRSNDSMSKFMNAASRTLRNVRCNLRDAATTAVDSRLSSAISLVGVGMLLCRLYLHRRRRPQQEP